MVVIYNMSPSSCGFNFAAVNTVKHGYSIFCFAYGRIFEAISRQYYVIRFLLFLKATAAHRNVVWFMLAGQETVSLADDMMYTWWDFSQLSGAGNVTEIFLQPILAKTKHRQSNYLYIIISQHNIEFLMHRAALKVLIEMSKAILSRVRVFASAANWWL